MALTTAHTDTQDFYREKVEGDKYLLNGKWRDLKIRN
jgi:acyl-homoserine lactone acylase PvdQ